MDKEKVTYKEILLIIGYLVVIITYEFVEHFGLIPKNSLLGVFLAFFGIISITLVYLLFIEKEPSSKIIYHIKIRLPYLAIPVFVSFLLIVLIPFFVSIKSNLFNIIILLVVIGSAFSSLAIKSILSKREKDRKKEGL